MFFAGMLLMAATAFAQNGPTFDPDRDAKVIFYQDFEADWDSWSTTPVDYINEIEYYNHLGDQNGQFRIWENPDDWQRGLFRTDSVITLYNNVMPTNDPTQIANNNFPNEQWSTYVDHSSERAEAMSRFGEDGGDYVFSYISDTCTAPNQSWGSYRGGYTANYCRNLFVRGLDIEDETSYRLTFYVKANTLPGHEQVTPRLYADVMRGYVNSEKPFSMGLENNASEYKYNATFEYEKTEFTGDWEKVTFMTYYLNDSIADNFMYSNGYWWGSDYWTWRADNPQNPTGMDLNYIVQPDKFFVRLSFASDFTEFKVDNLSLTKSWIAGAEYYEDKLRVDFGYKTNLSDLALNAYDQYKIAAVEVPGDYFEVWGQNHDGSWVVIPIRSAEYHGDGYMYLFTDFHVDGHGEEIAYTYDDYNQVLVTFRNPVDRPELTLKYTGTGSKSSEVFPKALDTEWIMSGKPVPDFYNEVATSNPYIFDGVYSMNDLPPVMQEPFYEDGSFGLDQSIRQLSFQFSRETALNNLLAYVGDEEWYTEWDDNTSSLVITRPAEYTSPLAGDYEINIVNIQGIGTDLGENVTLHYHFGSFERNPDVFYKTTDWKSEVTGNSRPYPTSIYIHSGLDPFMQGDGSDSRGKCGLYNMNGEGQYNCGFYLSNRVSGSTGNLYSIETLNKGDYILSFRACGWGTNSSWISGSSNINLPLIVKIYEKPDEGLYDGDYEGFQVLENIPNKVIIGIQDSWEASISSAGDWPDGSLDLSYKFSIPSDDVYVIEFFTEGSNTYNGVFFSNYSIRGYSDLSQLYTVPLSESIEKANALSAVAEADSWKYGGSKLNSFESEIDYYQNTFTSTAPSDWTMAKTDMDNATRMMKLRMDSVDMFVQTRENVVNKLTETGERYSGLTVWAALNEIRQYSESYDLTTQTGDEIYAFNAEMNAAIKALDDRIAINDALNAALAEAYDLIGESEKPESDEYASLNESYNNASAVDQINEADDVIITATESVNKATIAYLSRIQGSQIMPTRIFALAQLAEELGSDILDNPKVSARLETIETDDDQLADILKAAIKVAIYEMADYGDEYIDGLDLTPFIKNYHLYATPRIVDRSEYQLPSNANIGADPNGANIQYTQHQWNSGSLNGHMPIWAMIVGPEFDDLYPGWTVKSIHTGNAIVSPDMLDGYLKFNYLQKGYYIFDGQLAMDWNSRAELKTELVDLPVGQYTLGVDILSLPSSGSNQGASLTVNTPYDTYSCQTIEKMPQLLSVENILVTEEDEILNVIFDITSGNGMSAADNFFLTFNPDQNYDYGTALDEARDKLAYLLNDSIEWTEPQSTVSGANRIYMDNVTTNAGSQIVIPINMKNLADITAFSCDVILPSGLSFVGAELVGERANGHSLSSNVTYGWNATVSLACMSLSNNLFNGRDGAMINLIINVEDDLDGTLGVTIDNVEMVVSATKMYHPYSYTGYVTVIPVFEPGDVNKDGRISIADAVGIVNFIIGSDTQGLSSYAADANQDGAIDVVDAVWVVNKVIRKSYAPSRNGSRSGIASTLSMDDTQIAPAMSVPVRIDGMENEITAIQFNLRLPDGAELKNVITDSEHLVASNKQDDGTYTVVCLSINNRTFSGGGDAALTLELVSDESFCGGQVIMNNAKIVTPNCTQKNLGSIMSNISSGDNLTGVIGITNDNNSLMYDLQGRSIDRANGVFIRDGKKLMQAK